MYFKQETITPEIASEMLTKNSGNRKLNARRVSMLVNDIKNGNWTESPQPIAFDHDGNLIDGQHRLTAIKKSGIPVTMSVAYDTPREAVIDRTLERSLGDALYMRGIITKEMSSREVIAPVNRYFSNLDGRETKTASDTEKAKFINEHAEQIVKAIELTASNRKGALSKRVSVRTAVIGALICGEDPGVLKNFCDVLNTGFMENPNQSAAVVLKNYFTTRRNFAGQSAENEATIMAEMAIHDFVEGNPRRNSYRKKSHIYIKM